MPLMHSDFEFNLNNKTSLIEMREYIKLVDPYFDLRKLQTFFGNKAYYVNGNWVGVICRTAELTDRTIIEAASAGLLFKCVGHTARVDQLNAVAAARELPLTFSSDVADHGIAWRSVLYAGIIRKGLIHTGHGINKPLSLYDLSWWINQWSSEPVTDGEIIAAMDAPTVRCKLNWDMGTGLGWKDHRLLHVGDLGWYTGPFAHLIMRNDGKAPPPPGELYGYGYVDLDEARQAREAL